MMLMILSGSSAFAQLLAFTGASAGLVDLATSTSLSPVMIVITMQVVLLVLGTFMESLAMILLCVPIYFPIIEALHLSPIWFGAVMLLNMEMAAISPPFGFGLFVMKAVAPPGTTHDGRLSRHHSIPAAELHRDADYDLLPPDGALAAVASGEIATVFRSPRNLTYRRRTQ